MDTAVTMTVKVGRIGHVWHAAHVTMVLWTFGWWIVVYALHGIIAAVLRPSMTVEVPPGGRIEYRDGHPNVLADDEYLTPPTWRERLVLLVWLIPVGTLVALGFAAVNNR